MSNSLRIIFAGTPDFAAYHLEALLGSEHQIVGVFTQPDRPAGRGNKLTPGAVKLLALAHQLPIFQPASLRPVDNQQLVADLKADIMVVVAYGLILPQSVLDMPKYGCINIHGSLLPRWRGAAPIQRAIWAGDNETGITIMQMDAGLDTGDMLCKTACPILAEDTSATLYTKLAQLGPHALLNVITKISQGNITKEPQNESVATYAEKLSKEEAKLNWKLSAVQLERCIRAFNPWPVSYFIVDETPIKVWQADVVKIQAQTQHQPGTIIQTDKSGIQIVTSDGILNMTQLQPAGKKQMSAQDLLNSRKSWFDVGNVLI